jgi:hypothetical protein
MEKKENKKVLVAGIYQCTGVDRETKYLNEGDDFPRCTCKGEGIWKYLRTGEPPEE